MKNILCIAGDGIGPEIMKSALEILEVVSKKYSFEYKIEEELFGGASIDAYGEPFSDKLKEKIENWITSFAAYLNLSGLILKIPITPDRFR